jgi:hypothetical protein
MRKGGPQLRSTAVDPASNSSDLDVEDLADLFVAEALDIAQHNRGAKLWREGCECSRYVVVKVGISQLLGRIGPGARQAFSRTLAQTVESDLLSAPRTVEEQVGRNAMKPALKRPRLESMQ